MELTKDQKGFIDWFYNQDSRIIKLTGHAGTGKTTVLNYLMWTGTIFFCALSNQAKNILEGKVSSKRVYTIASLLGHGPVAEKGKMVFKKIKPDKMDADDEKLLIVDETSMVDPDMLAEIIATRANKIIFVGDPAQIPPIGYNESPIYSEEYADIPTYHLSQIVRQQEGSPIIELSQAILAHQETFTIDGIKEIRMTNTAISDFYRQEGSRVSVCATHAVKDRCNKIGRRVNNGGVDPEEPFLIGEQFFLESPILEGPQNGDIVKITSVPTLESYKGFDVIEFMVNDTHLIKVPLDMDVEKKIKNYYRHLEHKYSMAMSVSSREAINKEVEDMNSKIIFGSHGYAMTVHKAQGSTLDNVLVCTEGLEHFRESFWQMLYTAVTRAADSVTIGYKV